MSAPQLLRHQVGSDLAEHAKHPSGPEAEQAKGGLPQAVAQGAFAQQFGQFVCVQAARHGGAEADNGDHFAVVGVRAADLVMPLCVTAVDQLRDGPVVLSFWFLAIQQPEVSRLEIL